MMKTPGSELRRKRGVELLFMLAGIAGAFAIAVAAETLRIESVWSTKEPTVDGKLAEWASSLAALGSTPLSLGVRNDGLFLYVALASSDQSARMMLGAAGFTVWMDPAGKEKKSFGISIPPIMSAGPAIGTITSIEVLGASKDDRRRFELTYARTIGLDVAARMAEGVLVYEVRVPLSVSEAQPYGVRSAPGATIGLGIETGQLPRPGGRGEEGGRGGMGGGPPGGGGGGIGGGMGGGGMMGGGGGQPGGMGGGLPGGGREGMRELKPIKVWTVVRLAQAPV